MSYVLVVEDEADIRLLTRIMLENAGHRVADAATGEVALDLLRAERPDLVILDIRLPGIDGWEVLERMGTMDQPPPPVVVMSAHSSGHALARAKEMGSRGYLLKPFSQQELLDVVRDAVVG